MATEKKKKSSPEGKKNQNITSRYYKNRQPISKKDYEAELFKLQIELVKMQGWIKENGLRVVVLFEGRDAAGKGGVIKRITDRLNPRIARIVALTVPTEKEKTQWYFQRYVEHLPAAGEMVLFDRSWYNRAGVERVMGFCTEDQVQEFFRSVPELENMLIRSGIILIKYWFSVDDEEQERRFQERIHDIRKRWKLSPMDVASRSKWVEYSRAKDEMFRFTDTSTSPWYVVDANDKRWARLDCISHLLSKIPYKDLTPEKITLPKRQVDTGYKRPSLEILKVVPSYKIKRKRKANPVKKKKLDLPAQFEDLALPVPGVEPKIPVSDLAEAELIETST
ncbi:MAG: polyphosphate kinase 2 [Anaerolineaceae bacterium]|nr:polyphosphate kinase 2 [Anaerolineaceae bacterium]